MEEKKLTNTDYARIESILNPSDDKLPFGYYCPDQGGKVKWIANYDQKGQLVSAFEYEDGPNKQRKIGVHKNLDEVKDVRDQLVQAGWLKIKPPEITIKYEDGSDKPLNRDQKRFLAKKLEKMAKDNPFETK